jgi:hypothetical protein
MTQDCEQLPNLWVAFLIPSSSVAIWRRQDTAIAVNERTYTYGYRTDSCVAPVDAGYRNIAGLLRSKPLGTCEQTLKAIDPSTRIHGETSERRKQHLSFRDTMINPGVSHGGNVAAAEQTTPAIIPALCVCS